MVSSGLLPTVLVFIGIGAAFQGFQAASMNLTLEFGHRDELPMRIALANTASELAGTIGPLLGGALATALGYDAVFYASWPSSSPGEDWCSATCPNPDGGDKPCSTMPAP